MRSDTTGRRKELSRDACGRRVHALRKSRRIVMRSAQITGILAPLIAVSVVMQQILSLLGAQEVIGDFVTGMGGYYAVLFTAMAIVFCLGHDSGIACR